MSFSLELTFAFNFINASRATSGQVLQDDIVHLITSTIKGEYLDDNSLSIKAGQVVKSTCFSLLSEMTTRMTPPVAQAPREL